MTTYRVVCRRSGGWWAISAPDLKGVHSQARRLDQVPGMAREAIALMLNVAPETVQVEVFPEVPSPVSQALEARRAARLAEETADRATAAAAQALLDDGYTVRDAGALLGLSPQRISQIAPSVAKRSDDAAPPATRRAVAATRSHRTLSTRVP
jgi:predicted RNase H-like HicB family nuclease